MCRELAQVSETGGHQELPGVSAENELDEILLLCVDIKDKLWSVNNKLTTTTNNKLTTTTNRNSLLKYVWNLDPPNDDTFLFQDVKLTTKIRTPHQSGHFTNQDTSLIRTPH